MIAQKPSSCSGCPIESYNGGFVQIEGTGSRGILICGEAAGHSERQDSLPFRPQAESGSVLQMALRRAQIQRESCSIINVLRCQPSASNWLEGAPYEYEAIHHCRPNLDEAIRIHRPRVILALGGVALRTLTGLSGKNLSVTSIRGFILHSPQYDLPVVASLHPSYIRRDGMALLDVLTNDIILAAQVADGKLKAETLDDVNYEYNPSWDRAEQWYQNALTSNLPIAYDIETAFSIKQMDDSDVALDDDAITEIQFSLRPKEAIVFSWSPQVKEFAQRVLALPNDKWGQNVDLFDRPILKKHGVHINGNHYDIMVAWHCLQPDLPANLQFIASFFCPSITPWKHWNTYDKANYCGRDVDAVQRIGVKLFLDLVKRGVARGYYDHCVKLRPILDRMCERGLPVDVAEQQRLRGELETEMIAINIQIQSMAPKELQAFDPTNGFAQWPKEAQGYIEVLKGKKDLWRDIYKQFQLSYEAGGEFPRLTVHQIEQSTGMIYRKFGETYRWARTLEFNPASSKQMIAYAKFKGYAVPKVERSNGIESEQANEQVILEWAEKHGDELCKLVIDYKKRQKIIGTYIDGFKTNGDHRVHSTITFAPATGQLSSHKPSIMNFPKHGEFAKKIRKTIAARDGFKLIEIDMKSFHARTLGFEAGCADYMRLATLDIHSFVAAHLLKNQLSGRKKSQVGDVEIGLDIDGLDNWLQLPDDELNVKLKNIKSKYKELRDRKAKPCIAEGELVLTETGLKPIEKITLADRVWDGVEWVNHDGVVFQGIKEIMTYDGLTATPEHKVYTTQGQCIPFREAASLLLRLQTTGIERTAVRLPDSSFWRIQERERLSQDQGQMLIDWDNSMDLVRSSQERGHQILPAQWQVSDAECRCVGEALRRNYSSMQQPELSQIQSLRGSRDQVSVQVSEGVCPVHKRSIASQGLCGLGDISQGQQWTLRSGEFTVGDSQTEQSKQGEYSEVDVSGTGDVYDRLLRVVGTPIQLLLAKSLGEGLEAEWRTDNRSTEGLCEESPQGVQGQSPVVRKARVYDILNAGPRHRFTVSGKLVLNCILGIGFGMQANKLYKMNKESFTALKEAKEVLDLIKRLFPKVFQWQKDIQEKAHRQGYLLTRHGYLRRFFEVKRFDLKYQTWKSGESAEECLAFAPANDAFGEIRDRLIELQEKGLLEKYSFVNTIHDSVVFECPDPLVNECVQVVSAILERPSTVLIDARLGAFSCPCEASVGQDWSQLVEYKL